MEVKTNSPKPRKTDPFSGIIDEHLLSEMVLQHLNDSEVKNLFIVSPQWNKIAMSSEKCMKKFKMTIDCFDVEKLTTIIMNGRKYRELLVRNVGSPMSQKLAESIGSDLKILSVHRFVIEKVFDFLKLCGNVEKLKLEEEQRWFKSSGNINVGAQLKLPNLKNLELSCPSQSLLQLFDSVTTLELLFLRANGINYSASRFEEFLLQQDNLKSLTLYGKRPTERESQRMFSENTLKDVKFKLETLVVDHFFVDKSNAVEFFKKQETLKFVELRGFCDPSVFNSANRIEYTNILAAIFTLPKLEMLKVDAASVTTADLEAFGKTRNNSVKHLTLFIFDDSTVSGKLFNIFPCLDKVCVIPFLTNQLKLQGVPAEKLELIRCGSISSFTYQVQPPAMVVYDAVFEDKLVNFIAEHRSIKHLSIGEPSWIQHGFGQSIKFWENIILHLPDLETILIYNPRKIKELIVELKNKKHKKMKKVTFVTNSAGKQAVKKATKEKSLPWLIVQMYPNL